MHLPALHFQGWCQAGKVKTSHLLPPMSSPLPTSSRLPCNRSYWAGIKNLQRQAENNTKPNFILKQKCSAKKVDKYEYVIRNHDRDHPYEDDPQQLLDQNECGNIVGAAQSFGNKIRCNKAVENCIIDFREVATFRETVIGLLLLVTT